MATVAEFVGIRQQIESIVKQVAVLTERRKAVFDSVERLERANALLQTLKTMADNDVQESCVGRLTKELASVRTKVDSLAKKKRVTKKQPTV